MKKFLTYFATTYLSLLVLFIVLSPWLFTGSYLDQNVDRILWEPQVGYLFGTDSLGRDLFLRTLAGGRVSLLVGVLCALLSFVVGLTYGSVAGWFEGRVDRMMMRFCDILMAIPSFILVSVLCLSLQLVLPFSDPYWMSLVSLVLGISATHWMTIARVTRGKVLEIKRKPYVEAAVSIGGTPVHILLRHILPNMLGTLMVLVALQIPSNILYESFMSFIGLGIHPPETSWGILVREGWKTLSTFPHLILFPSLILFLTVWSFHILVDSVKDLFRL